MLLILIYYYNKTRTYFKCKVRIKIELGQIKNPWAIQLILNPLNLRWRGYKYIQFWSDPNKTKTYRFLTYKCPGYHPHVCIPREICLEILLAISFIHPWHCRRSVSEAIKTFPRAHAIYTFTKSKHS